MTFTESMKEMGYWQGLPPRGTPPDYEAVPLQYEEIGVAAVQKYGLPLVDPNDAEKGKKQRLDDMLRLCEAAALTGAHCGPKAKTSLVVFSEFTLSSFSPSWTIDEWRRVCIEVPGKEIEAIGKKAKELDIYVAFATHITEPDEWPGHYFNCSMIVAPTGELIHKHWKAYLKGPGYEWGTSVHDVLDEFIKRYGQDAAWPVARTPIGNIATYTCSEGFAPETARAFALKGAEILCWCIGGGGVLNRAGKFILEFRAQCSASGCYGIKADGAGSDMGASSMIVDYYGRILNQAPTPTEEIVYERIPIAWFRQSRERPYIRTELYALALDDSPGRFPPNLYSDYGMPKSAVDANRLSTKHARWG